MPPSSSFNFYEVQKNANVVASVKATGYTASVFTAIPLATMQGNGYLLFASSYQATSGGAITYGLKRVNLSNGNVVDIESGLSNEITAILVDGEYIVYTYGNTCVKKSADGSTVVGTYTGNNAPLVLLGKIGGYYYVGHSKGRAGTSAKYLNVDIIYEDTMTLRESRETDSKATIINSMPYVSDNEYLCFGTYHAVTYSTQPAKTIQTTYRTLPTGSLGDVEYKIVRIHGF